MVAGPFAVVLVLLGLAGATKVYRPAPTAQALRAMGLPGSPAVVRLAGAAEVTVAVAAFLTGSPLLALLVAAFYLAFAAFVLVALRRRVPLSSCGCFGAADTPPTVTHLVLDLAAAAVAAAVAVSGSVQGGVGLPGGGLATKSLFALFVALASWFAYMALTLAPRVMALAAGLAGQGSAR